MKSLILKGKKAAISLMMAGVITTGSFMDIVMTKINQGLNIPYNDSSSSLSTIQQNSLMAISNPVVKPIKKMTALITAYSSRPEETDDTPFITASGKNVADGIVANNLLPFGAKIKMPELYGDKIFEVQDRMNRRKGDYHFDIWFAETREAKNFGAKISTIEIMEI